MQIVVVDAPNLDMLYVMTQNKFGSITPRWAPHAVQVPSFQSCISGLWQLLGSSEEDNPVLDTMFQGNITK